MEWLALSIFLGIIIGTWRLYPTLIAAQCPICFARLQSIPEHIAILGMFGWCLVWHRFVCPECLFRWRRLEIARCPKGINA
jgi:hypothetical protein